MFKPRISTTQQAGFALLIGVMVSAILISITYVMFSITLKQVSLSTTGRNSQYALYAADTGLECALYADNNIVNEFSTPVSVGDTGINITPGVLTPFICNGETIGPSQMTTVNSSVTVSGTPYPALATTFYVHYPAGENAQRCARVTVSKYEITDTSRPIAVEKQKTKIESRGYNTCPDPNFSGYIANDPQRVERGLEVYY
jgi:Tfp pilus assembly protein PilX